MLSSTPLAFELPVGELPHDLGADDYRDLLLGLDRVHDGVGEHGAVGREVVEDPVRPEALLALGRLAGRPEHADVALEVGAGDGVLQALDLLEVAAVVELVERGEQDGPLGLEREEVAVVGVLHQRHAAGHDHRDLALDDVIGVDLAGQDDPDRRDSWGAAVPALDFRHFAGRRAGGGPGGRARQGRAGAGRRPRGIRASSSGPRRAVLGGDLHLPGDLRGDRQPGAGAKALRCATSASPTRMMSAHCVPGGARGAVDGRSQMTARWAERPGAVGLDGHRALELDDVLALTGPGGGGAGDDLQLLAGGLVLRLGTHAGGTG